MKQFIFSDILRSVKTKQRVKPGWGHPHALYQAAPDPQACLKHLIGQELQTAPRHTALSVGPS